MRFTLLISATSTFCLAILLATIKPAPTPSGAEEKKNFQTDGPANFIEFHQGIRTREGESKPGYDRAYLIKELKRAKQRARAVHASARVQSGPIEWKERGPANVPGRTRGLLVDPDDAAKNTWFAGSVAGGVWKTTNGGQTWTLLTPDFPNLATTVLAMAESNHDVIYLGTGEGFGNVDGVRGNGMYKSTDRGQTWDYLTSTSGFSDVNRAIVDPANEDIVVVATNEGIQRTADGGTTWQLVSSEFFIQDLKATPGNFQVQYAAQNAVGVLKSVDGGLTWNLSSSGLVPDARIELAISPATPARVFAAAEGSVSGTGSDLYVSDDAGVSWSLVNVSFSGSAVDFLGGQGWYDNTLACDPFNDDIVYLGAVGMFRVTLTGSGQALVYTAEEVGTSFMSLVNFTNGSFYNGRIQLGPSATGSVEVRFGPGQSQKAHRFLVPAGATSGVPDANYSYQDYIDVPFEVWEVDNNGNDVRQLMVSFRDQGRDGAFNLILSNTTGGATEQSREYVYINNVTYSHAAPSASIMVNGGQVFNQMYFFWPVLAEGSAWDPGNLPASEFRIFAKPAQSANTITVADVYNQFDGKNRFQTFGVDVHPDQHNIVMIPMTGSTYKILVANDGGLFISNTSATPGINQGNWTMVGRTYNTTQFYGADKRPGKNEYLGGSQDNGTWRSPANQSASFNSDYIFALGGDGFEVLWHSLNDKKLIGGSQFNGFARSVNGGSTWGNATTGLTGDAPFISKLANSKDNPETIFTVSSSGVFRSTNFGQNWTLTPITEKWGASTFLDVEVSRANANIVWAGSGMTSSRSLHVSVDGGSTFTVTNNFALIPNYGRITRLASHPFEKNTAYATFSFSDDPKILRTTDLGQTWQDISGFGLADESSNGFPDVAVYCLYVRPDDPNILWAGTEIGIVESLDNGLTWALREDFPNVSVWDMKGQDDQVVIATHGRGIWTATIGETQSSYIPIPEFVSFGTSPRKELMLRISTTQFYDSIQVWVNNQKAGTVESAVTGTYDVAIKNLTPGTATARMVAFIEDAPYSTPDFSAELLNLKPVQDSYLTYFNSLSELKLDGLTKQSFSGSPANERKTLQTHHPYQANTAYRALVLHPLRVSATNPVISIGEIAITEPGNDTLLVEVTENGLDWLPLTNAYDASANSAWLAAYTGNQPGASAMFERREIDLADFAPNIQAGDTLLVRFSLYTNATNTGWGWALDYIALQEEPTQTEQPANPQQALALYPNPANDEVTLEYFMKQPGMVELALVDMTGKTLLVKNLSRKESGKQTEKIRVVQVAEGNYRVVVKTGSGTQSKALVVKR